MKTVITEIFRQLNNWNILTCQSSVITTFQKGFKFNTEDSEKDGEINA